MSLTPPLELTSDLSVEADRTRFSSVCYSLDYLYRRDTPAWTHVLHLCVCVVCRAAEPRPRAGEGGQPVAVGRFSHHVWRWTSVWGKVWLHIGVRHQKSTLHTCVIAVNQNVSLHLSVSECEIYYISENPKKEMHINADMKQSID